ncbi:Tubulin alpha-3 chain, related [Eimeria necatrix]|uniref:Tubulin alpha-3 chain, related n=1 Tax=Eimeria necatrix TaxID=51315 RepID=U6MLK3_9EIME|nr:Tubulin alpha-3 chain, related [Eimeria necatrix]CDJ64901.1 Tubulin alpha-3 chain, related [Eimeria necatrix]
MVRQIISIHTGQAGLRSGAAFWDLLLAEQGLSYEGLPFDSTIGAPWGAPGGAPWGTPGGAPWGAPGGPPCGAVKGCPLGSPAGSPLGSPLGAPLGGPLGAPLGPLMLEQGPPGTPSWGPLGPLGATAQAAEDCFFTETEAGRRVPRCAMLDLDLESRDEILKSPLGRTFSPFSFFSGKENASSLFPRGRALGSADPTRSLFQDLLRQQLEATDKPGASCVEPYNALLALTGVLDRGGGALLMDNSALAALFSRATSRYPFTQDLNNIIAQALSSVTLSLRFPSAATCCLGSLLSNSVPLPSLALLSASYFPLAAKELLPFLKTSTKDTTLEVFKQRQFLFSAPYTRGMFLTANLFYR